MGLFSQQSVCEDIGFDVKYRAASWFIMRTIIFCIVCELGLHLLFSVEFSAQRILTYEFIWGFYGVFTGELAGSAINPFLAFGLSIFRTVTVIVISAVIGPILGVLVYICGKRRKYIVPYLDFIRSIPVTFLIPTLYWVQIITLSWWLPIVLAAIPCSLIVAVGIIEKSSEIDSNRLHLARSLFREDESSFAIHFLFWELFSGFLVGLKTGIPYAAILIGVVEYAGVGITPGFGTLVYQMHGNSSNAPSFVLLAAVSMYGAFGLILLLLAGRLANSVLSWDMGRNHRG